MLQVLHVLVRNVIAKNRDKINSKVRADVAQRCRPAGLTDAPALISRRRLCAARVQRRFATRLACARAHGAAAASASRSARFEELPALEDSARRGTWSSFYSSPWHHPAGHVLLFCCAECLPWETVLCSSESADVATARR